MKGRELLFTVSLLSLGLPPVCSLSTDVMKQSSTPYQLLYNPLDDLDDAALNGFVPFSGKAAFSR